jgi:hypothetical protein
VIRNTILLGGLAAMLFWVKVSCREPQRMRQEVPQIVHNFYHITTVCFPKEPIMDDGVLVYLQRTPQPILRTSLTIQDKEWRKTTFKS